MANTIKLKRGSGSDPGSSDLAVGELAIRTDEGKLFTKKDDGSVAEISGGGIDDGDKGDITVSSSGATWTIDNDAVTYAKIQDVSATNRILGRDSSGSGVIEEISPSSLRTMINVADGATNVTNTNQLTNGAGFITATLTEEQVEDYVGGMVTGNTETGITVTYQDSDGTLDFVVASQTDNNFTTTLKNKLDGIAASATNVTNNNQLTNGAGYITATLTEEQVEDYVGGMVTGNTETGITVTYQDSDGTLDFVVASQTDNNFTNADHSKLDGIESGATADQTASEILTLIKTVDGAGSGLDADTLDGVSSGSFLRSDADDSTSGRLTINRSADEKLILTNSSNPYITFEEGSTDKAYVQWHSDGYLKLQNAEDSSSLRVKDTLDFSTDDSTWHTVWHAGNDGSGSGLDADTCDGQHLGTSSSPTFADIYTNGWFRNNDSGDGMYNQNTGQHWYSDHDDYWNIAGGGSANGIRFRDSHAGTIRGYVYADNNNAVGFLDSEGQWKIRGVRASHIEFRVSNTIELTVLPDTVRCEGAFFENAQAVAADKTISDGYNAMSCGPITINSSVTVTVGSGEVWTII